MTSAGATAVFSENGLDMIAKTPIEWFVHCFDRDLDGGGLFADFGSDGCNTIGYGNGFILFDADDFGIVGDELDVVCDLADELVVKSFFEDKVLARFRTVESDGGGKNGEWGRCR